MSSHGNETSIDSRSALQLSSAFAQYSVAFRLEDLPQADRAHLVDAFVNWVGCALGGSHSPAADAAAHAYRSISPNGVCRALGRRQRFDVVHAISLDCIASSVLAFDDTHLETVLHPTGPVAAALLGLARTRKVAGSDFIAALHVGMEVECRAGLAFASSQAGASRGWYSTGLAGGIGAAVAVGRILDFTEVEMQNAIGLAAARASGNRGTHGSMAGVYVPAVAAESGFIAAKLTEAGFSCGARSFDGPSGLLELIAKTPAIDRALGQLGSVSEAARTAFKPYPSGIVTHQVIDACLALVREHGAKANEIAKLHFRISKTANDLVANRRPKDEIQAKVSLFYWASVALTFGAAGIDETASGLLTDPKLLALQDLITVEVDERLGDDQCFAEATLSGERTLSIFVEHASGSIDRPMTSAEIDGKFSSLAGISCSADEVVRIHAACRDVLALADVAAILEP